MIGKVLALHMIPDLGPPHVTEPLADGADVLSLQAAGDKLKKFHWVAKQSS